MTFSIMALRINNFKLDFTLSSTTTLSIMKLRIMTFSINNGKEATVNRALDSSTYPG